MPLENGERIHVVMRRRYESDIRRHFAGEVEELDGTIARVTGYAFVFDPAHNEWVRRGDSRTRLISLADAGNLVTVLPLNIDIDQISYDTVDGRLVITDGGDYTMDINEFGPNR